VVRQVEGTVVMDDQGRPVMLVKETRAVVMETEQGHAVAVQTEVRREVLGNDHERQPILGSRRADDDDDNECSCWCVLKWILQIPMMNICLPCSILVLIYVCCCASDN